MTANHDKTYRLKLALTRMTLGLALVSTASASIHAQEPADSKLVDAKPTDTKPTEVKAPDVKTAYTEPRVELYKVFYLTNINQHYEI